MYKKSLSGSGKKLSRYLVFFKKVKKLLRKSDFEKTKYRDNFFPDRDSDFLYIYKVILIFDGPPAQKISDQYLK